MYMCVRAALNSKKENDYHKRFNHLASTANLKTGRSYNQVMVACMRMMIVRLNAITRDWISKGKPDLKTYLAMKEQESEQKHKELVEKEKKSQEQ